MSYLVLARKYRPQSFADVVGQVPVVKTLQNSLLRNRVAHAILFSGVRGVGKTTLARIMAKAINCEGNKDKPPCNNCRSCLEITQGAALDLVEIDGASNRGIQEIRELKEKIRFLPSASKYKIIIIDEVHMLTTEAFNALLKTLEEPPDHVYFMFATTELHKIPITILSRCQRYELKRISADELGKHFQRIATAEEISLEPAALSMIVREAGGSVRDGLSLLDQMFSFGDSTITHEDVIQVLGLTDRNAIMIITSSLLSEDRSGALKALDQAFDFGIDIKRFTGDLLQSFRTLLLLKIEDCPELIDLPAEEIDNYRKIAVDFSLETIHMKLNLLLQVTEELRYTNQPRLALETAFLKIIEAGNVLPVNTLLGKLDNLLQSSPHIGKLDDSSPAKKKLETSPIKAELPLVGPSPTNAELPQEAVPPPEEEYPPPMDQIIPHEEQLPNKNDSPMDPSSFETFATRESESEAVSAIEIHPHTHDVRRDWDEFTTYVKDRKVWMSQDLQRAVKAREVDGELHLHYVDSASCALLRKKENRKLLTEFVLDFFQKDLTVRFMLPDTNGNGNENEESESPHKQRQQLAHDPLVQMTVEIFSGQVGDIRIGPRARK